MLAQHAYIKPGEMSIREELKDIHMKRSIMQDESEKQETCQVGHWE